MTPERVDKLLANAGYGSRREITAAIKKGQLLLDGAVCRQPDYKLVPQQTHICFCGQEVCVKTQWYLMLNKPAGVITATKDAQQQTVIDLLPQHLRKIVFAVGRLDKDTRGLLLLTTDGTFDHALMSPRGHVPKVYRAWYTGVLAEDAQTRFAQGLTLRDGTICRPADLQHLAPDCVQITLTEGKYHQVKRMLQAIGGQVTQLCRTQIGSLQLDAQLEEGHFRELTQAEREDLLKQAQQRKKAAEYTDSML